ERGRKILGHRNQWSVGGPVAEIEIRLIEGPGNPDQQPATVRREAYARPVLLLSGTELNGVGGWIGSESVKEDRAVIVFLALGHLTWRGVACVIEPAAVRQPREVGGPSARDAFGECLPGFQIEDVQNALLAAVLGQSIGQESSVVAGIVPVECGGSSGVERV